MPFTEHQPKLGECEAATSEDVSDCSLSWGTNSCTAMRETADFDSDYDDQNTSADEEHDSDDGTESCSIGVPSCSSFDVIRVIKHRALQVLLDNPRQINHTHAEDLNKYPKSSCRFGNTVFREGFIVTEGVGSRVQEGCDIYTLAVIDEEPGMVLQEVAQVVFFFRGSLHPDVLPICKDYPPVFEAWDSVDAEDCSDLPAIAYTLAGLESEFMAHIWHACTTWLCTVILVGDLSNSNAMEEQSCRLNYWDIEMRDIDIENIFAVLQPGVDIDRVTKEDKWRRWARILAMQLVDDIYVFHFAQSPSPILDNHIIARFGAASTRDVLQDMLHVHIKEIPVGGELSRLLLSV